MTEYMHLVGAEDVRSAASSMRSAADDMLRAANTISSSMEQMSRLVDRLEQSMAYHAERLEALHK
jgi:methyl-accepting chemotaxis protein